MRHRQAIQTSLPDNPLQSVTQCNQTSRRELQANMFGTTNRRDRSLSDLCNRLAPLPSAVYMTPVATATQQSLVMLKSSD
eukprot:627048-Alexandrium_andersonii.AAC.1